MRWLITDGKSYLTSDCNSYSAVFTEEISNARVYKSVGEFKGAYNRHHAYLKGFNVLDLDSGDTLYITCQGRKIKSNSNKVHLANFEKIPKQKKDKKQERIIVNDNGTEITKAKRKSFSKNTRDAVYMRDGGICQICGKKITKGSMTIDHIIPLAKGGQNQMENYACTCKQCNSFKAAQMPDDFNRKITSMFVYQTEKAHKKDIRWILCKMIISSF